MVSPTAVAWISCQFEYIGAVLHSGFSHVDNLIPTIKTITWLLLSRLQSNKPHQNFQTLPPEPTLSGTLRNLLTSETVWNQPFGNFRNLPPKPMHTPEPCEIFQNLPELASGTYTILHWNSPEPFGTCLRNLHQHTPEPSGTFWNLPPEPTPAHTGTLWNLPRNLLAPATRTSTHQSLSGLKTPLGCAVGEIIKIY